MLRILLLLLTALATCSLSSCLDVVPLDVPTGQPLLAVDGQLTDQGTPAIVTLGLTQAYFTNTAPPPVRGANLTLTDDLGQQDVLRETSTPGTYRGTGAVRGRIGGHYTLTIVTDGQTYRAETDIRRTPPIDSLGLEYKAQQLGYDEGYYVLYYGPELPGVGDYYRFKVYKNGALLNQPDDLFISSDELVDGKYINGIELNNKPFVRGDNIKVELLSLSPDYFHYLNELSTQINNQGLFATSPANVRTNVKNTQSGSAKSAVGYFAGYTVRADSTVVK